MKAQDIKDHINRTKEFMELWIKFHQIFKEAMNKSSITPEEEESFLQTKSMLARKFQTIVDSVSIDRPTVDRAYDVINQILFLKGISTLSEQTLKKMENDWHESYISLNRLLGHLEAQRDMLSSQREGLGKRAWKVAVKIFLYLAVTILFVLVILFLLVALGILKVPGVK